YEEAFKRWKIKEEIKNLLSNLGNKIKKFLSFNTVEKGRFLKGKLSGKIGRYFRFFPSIQAFGG
ncbi:MAG: hypothetical protein PX634_24010, partial [Microcystis sp. M53600_WE12]|nr:hypothetical protein [Microcystis sp. M53600_WE12]